MGRRFVLAGNVIVDLVLDVPALPERGGDMAATRTERTVGGGFNTLVAVRRLGGEAAYAGLHGTGPNGDLARAALAAEGITVLLPARGDGDTGFTVALVDPGERTFVTGFGVEATVTDADTAAVAGRLRPDDIVDVSGYSLAQPAGGPPLARFTAGLPAGVTVCVDPGPLVADIPRSVLDPVLARADWLSCNDREAALLSGIQDGPAAAASALRERLGDGTGVLVRAGRDGCFVAPPGGEAVHVPGVPVEAVDSSGAGDAHTGVFLTLLGEGMAVRDAAWAANAAAAWAVGRHGPATAPTRAELVGFLGVSRVPRGL
ncbi:PfkB family carbohydrate kinase [Streptomyces sp. TS71-3]|uniref:PfkB family carbohydrate kinase n=1 Tax=Streptomyces sp. TS71-3 TaxID=2733862 RepID=UPI001B2AC2DE|nr:PfkB family carbohydrate kinase [Streptomyces sp. TS71-3]GHJ36746.1 ribokinase [Streptomyces sp. TS71-3]